MKTKPAIRYLEDIKDVLYDQSWAKTAPNFEIYYMHRGVKEKDDLRYDITIIPARMLGQEFVKTKGHYHVSFRQELYTVLSGQAIFLVQKTNKNKVEDIYAVKAKAGDVIVIPTGYGHITINPSKEELKMANWVSKKSKSDYSFIVKNHGACYFALKKGRKIEWVINERYKDVPKLRFVKPSKSIPKDLTFLK
ncbi:MAG: glucose-6-phosphate isomerase family protein [bacterium]